MFQVADRPSSNSTLTLQWVNWGLSSLMAGLQGWWLIVQCRMSLQTPTFQIIWCCLASVMFGDVRPLNRLSKEWSSWHLMFPKLIVGSWSIQTTEGCFAFMFEMNCTSASRWISEPELVDGIGVASLDSWFVHRMPFLIIPMPSGSTLMICSLGWIDWVPRCGPQLWSSCFWFWESRSAGTRRPYLSKSRGLAGPSVWKHGQWSCQKRSYWLFYPSWTPSPNKTDCNWRSCNQWWVDCYGWLGRGTIWDLCWSPFTKHSTISLSQWWVSALQSLTIYSMWSMMTSFCAARKLLNIILWSRVPRSNVLPTHLSILEQSWGRCSPNHAEFGWALLTLHLHTDQWMMMFEEP